MSRFAKASLLWLAAIVFSAPISKMALAQGTKKVSVDSSKVVNATGIHVTKGQMITIKATGTSDLSDANGSYVTNPSGTIVTAPAAGSGAYNFFLNASPVGVPPTAGGQKFITSGGQSNFAAYGALVAGFSTNSTASTLSDFSTNFIIVGTSSQIKAPIDGYLFLAVNDINNTSDNAGSYSATVKFPVR